ncbi:MAG: hypoxanthine phosphoribosyltransferase [Verrucomicrobiota bacterium]|nr:hypoxanthine phosphoribosyltransferase [Verrucomicrobiota bacterium]
MELKPLLTAEQIHRRIREVGKELTHAYQNKDLCIVLVLKGAICFVADLIRALDLPFHLEVIQCKSYGHRGTERGDLEIIGLDRLHIHNRDVLLVDDVFDSGATMHALYQAIAPQRPRSLKSCVLLKKKIEHTTDIRPDYVLFEIDNLFVVGYGLDYKEHHRGLPGVFVLTP